METPDRSDPRFVWGFNEGLRRSQTWGENILAGYLFVIPVRDGVSQSEEFYVRAPGRNAWPGPIAVFGEWADAAEYLMTLRLLDGIDPMTGNLLEEKP